MDKQRVRESLDSVVGQIRTYVPVMAPYFEDDRPLGDYAHGLRTAPDVAPEHAQRQQQIAHSVRRVLQRSFGPGGPAARVTVESIRVTNIVDHHQVLNHPLLLGTNIIGNAARLLSEEAPGPIVTLSCSNVNPSNAYMRNGFRFRGTDIPYFSAKEHRDVMYYLRPRPFDFVQRLHRMKRWAGFTPADKEFLEEYQSLLNGLDHSRGSRHRDQLASVVQATWPLLFSRELRPRVPDLLYANAEDVAREALIEVLAQENFLSEALFDAEQRQHVLDTFRGVVVAWDEAAGKGTHFFWRRHPDRPRLLRLYVEGDALVPADRRYSHLRVPLERQALCEALHREDIIPSVALYMTLLLHAGVRPLVGPGSLVYTTQLKDGWLRLLDQHGHAREARLLAGVDVTGMVAGTPVFFERAGSTLRTLYAADVISAGGVDRPYLERVLRTPFKDVLSVGSSGVYDLFSHTYIPADQRLTESIGFDEAATVVHDWL
ncbi:hypothetical protein GCM10018793_30600 [Streptomyces sulfonofaciens]|uniref:Uncharacterized protein n=1 Tax=Streptomyces sulfonofaciens TaxID=68272 RepID=A0A919G6I9_9ACTN|nr:hypothetical protein [Streptomyces sulfonofaciens]GHH78992.1 hypothetical protein GCM10018793_30600 [Streptomyces sulfonofaciens]